MVTVDPEKRLLDALHETLLGLMGRLDLEDLLQDIVRRAADLVGTAHGYVYLAEPGMREMEVRVGVGFHEQFLGQRVAQGQGLAGMIWQSGVPLVVPDYRTWGQRLSLPGYDRLRAVVGVPLMDASGVVGVLALSRVDEDRGFGELEVEVLSRFAELASVAIVNARLHADVQSELLERTRAEWEARRSEDHYRTLFEAVQDAIVLLEGERVVDCNRAAARLFRGRREELVGRPVAALFPDTQPGGRPSAEYGERYAVKAVRGQPQRFEWRFRKLDGVGFDSEVSLDRVQIGERSRIVVLIHDVTRRKALQRQLLHVQKMEAVGRLAGGVAHDFNNLLAAMMGAAEVAAMRLDAGEDARDQLDEVVDTGERGAELIRQLLAFSEERVARPERLELRDVVRGVGPMLVRLLGQGIALELTLDEETPAVVGDRSQLERVLVNLAVNARDAMGGHGTLTVSVGPAPGGEQARMVVEDDGAGMTEEVREQVFEPFFTTKELGQGTGLGLATVQGIVVQAGGTIAVDSAPGEGTRFEIRWPRAADDLER